MPLKRRRRFQGLYYHSSPPKVLPMNGQASNHGRRRRDVDDFSIKLSTIRIWMHEKDIGKLTRILWAGQGSRLCQQASTNPRVKRFLAAVPYVMNSIKDVHQAVIDNTLEKLQAKMEPPVPPALITCRDANGLNLIHKAAGLGHTKILEYLISIWPDGITETDITGKTPLHWAASHKNNMRCYTLLTQAGCDEEAMDYKMKTPTYYRHKPHEIERAFLVYVPEAPRVSPDITTDWEALSEDVGDGVKKLDIKVPDANGLQSRTTDDSIENTSELDLNDGISATEEQHPVTPTTNGMDNNNETTTKDNNEEVSRDKNGDENVNVNDNAEISAKSLEPEVNDDVVAETKHESNEADLNEVENEPKFDAIALEGKDAVEAEVKNGEEQTIKPLNETTATPTTAKKSEENEEEKMYEAEEEREKSKDAGESESKPDDMQEKDKKVITGSVESEGIGDEDELANNKEEDVLKETTKVEKVNKGQILGGVKESKEDDERSKQNSREVETEKPKLAELIAQEEITKDTSEEEDDIKIEETEKEEGVLEKIKKGPEDLATTIKSAIGVETNVLDKKEKEKKLEETTNETEIDEAINTEKKIQDEQEHENNEAKEKDQMIESEDREKKEEKDNVNEQIQNEFSSKETVSKEIDKEQQDGNKNPLGDEKEENSDGNEKINDESKKNEKDVKEDNKNELKENEGINDKKLSEDDNKENKKVEDSKKSKDQKATKVEQNENENEINVSTTTNVNNNNNKPSAESPTTKDATNKIAAIDENAKTVYEQKKESEIEVNDKTEEDVSNEINKTLDNVNGKPIEEIGNEVIKNVLREEKKPPTAEHPTLKNEKMSRLTTAKVRKNKQNGSAKRNGSGKKKIDALVEYDNNGDGDDDDEDDDDDEGEDDEVQFGML